MGRLQCDGVATWGLALDQTIVEMLQRPLHEWKPLGDLPKRYVQPGTRLGCSA